MVSDIFILTGKSRKSMDDYLADSSDDEFDDEEEYVEGVTKSKKKKKQKDDAFIQVQIVQTRIKVVHKNVS